MHESKFNQGNRVRIKSDNTLVGTILNVLNLGREEFFYKVKFEEIEPILTIYENKLEKVV